MKNCITVAVNTLLDLLASSSLSLLALCRDCHCVTLGTVYLTRNEGRDESSSC